MLIRRRDCKQVTGPHAVHFKCTAWALVLGAVHVCCIERQLITLQLELAGGQLELELELAI